MEKELLDQLRSQVAEILPRITQMRHLLHSKPEAGLETAETASKIRTELEGTSLSFQDPLLGNDVIADLDLGHDRRICLRADIDCNQIQELNDLPYKSQRPGLMHACGHDGHTAILIGAALVLDSLKDQLRANIRFVFQPGEELIGAGRQLVERGACDNCDAAFALHCWPGLKLGTVSTKAGPLWAAGTHFRIEVTGKGSHGAMPEKGSNPIPVAARITERLQQLHEEVNPQDGSVVSVTSFQAGTNANVIPDSAVLLGTARYLSEERGQEIRRKIQETAEETGREGGVRVTAECDSVYEIPAINSQWGYERVRQAALGYLQQGSWQELARPSMGMEDFAYYLKGCEGAQFFLGLGEEHPGLHTPTFDFDDTVLETGVLMFCLIALEP